jgi:hypothetical protein
MAEIRRKKCLPYGRRSQRSARAVLGNMQASPLNSGIHGLPPGFDMGTRLHQKLTQSGTILKSELDEQGLQAAVLPKSKLFVVGTDDVSICSAFPMHQQGLGPVRRALRGSKFKADAMDL